MKIPNLAKWDKSQPGNSQPSSQIGTCLTLPNLGFLWVFFKYSKISKNGNRLFFPVHDVAFIWQPRELSRRLKHWLSLGFATWTVLVLGKASIKINSYKLLKEWIHAFVAKLGNRCFCWFLAVMLVPLRVRATWHLHTSSVKLGKTFL